MTEQPANATESTGAAEEVVAGPTAELVVRERYPAAAPPRRLHRAAVKARARLVELRQHPAAAASVSAAATIGSAVLMSALRRASQHAATTPAAGRTSVTIGGYIVHEVHVIHHVVHQIGSRPADR